MEKKDQFNEASKKYERAITLSNGDNERALHAMRRISLLTNNKELRTSKVLSESFCNSTSSSSKIEVIDLSDESESDQKPKKKLKSSRENGSSQQWKTGIHQDRSLKIGDSRFEFKIFNDSEVLEKKRYSSLSASSSVKDSDKTDINKSLTTHDSLNKFEVDNRKKLQEMEAFIAQLRNSK